jgi:3-deoxy-D-manno-octulosonic-acid transferase
MPCRDYRLPGPAAQQAVGSPAAGKYNRRVYFAYSALLLLALALSSPWWLLEMLRHGKYRTGLRERLGAVPPRLAEGAGETIWIHAVSVGEVLAVTRMVEELKAHLPGWRVVVSTTTDTGQNLARQRFGCGNVFYFPLDLSFAVKAYLRALQPKLLVLAESEFWPNLLHQARVMGIPVAVVNARVSDRSLPRYLRFRSLLRGVMRNVDVFLAQSQEDAQRLVRIGAPSERVHVGGNLKFEVKPAADSEFVDEFSEALDREEIGPVLVAGSTLEGEDALLLDCFRQMLAQFPQGMMVLAPRHPERFGAVGTLLDASGLPWQRRSQWNGQSAIAGWVLLLDTIGELASLYEFSDVAFVGGSLVPKGGHNVLEAAQSGSTILIGPHTENFRDIVGIFQRADALRVVTPESLASTVLHLLQNDAEREGLGQRALEVMQAQQGATERTVAALMNLLPSASVAAKVSAERQA